MKRLWKIRHLPGIEDAMKVVIASIYDIGGIVTATLDGIGFGGIFFRGRSKCSAQWRSLNRSGGHGWSVLGQHRRGRSFLFDFLRRRGINGLFEMVYSTQRY